MGIPQTGRIGRFAKILKKEVDHEIYLHIMQNSENYVTYKPDQKAGWWQFALDRMETSIGKEQAIEIMQACGRKCCNQGNRKTAKRLMDESGSFEEFLEKSAIHGVKEGEIEYKLLDDRTVVGYFYRCFCGQVKQTRSPFPNTTYCHCSAEFHKQYFEAALEKPVRVEIVQSIINGAPHCKFLINLSENEE